ncbi:MAG: DMT family transporter [Acidimicrobiales bacterium]
MTGEQQIAEPDIAGVAATTGVAVEGDGDSAVAPVLRSRRLPATAEGRSSAAFEPFDWALIALTAAVWGSSFLLIAEGLETLEPGIVAFGRLAFGFLALTFVPRARRTKIDRDDWGRIVVLGFVWLTVPMVMFPIAEQWVSSAIAGMLNGAVPLMAALIASLLLRRAPGRHQLAGLAVGFLGVIAISLPSMQGGSRTALGASLVLVALLSYGFAGNFVVPLQQRYGALPVIWRAQMAGLVFTTPYALVGVPDSSLAWRSVGAVVILGALGTGVAFVAAGTLFGRVGATRGSVIGYLIPVVALGLGVVLRNEHVEAIAVAGLFLVLGGAWLTSRAGR